MFFGNLTAEKQKQILDYELSIYVCEGTEGEKLDWFKIINIAGEKLTEQELRNAIYTGPWLADAKKWFSRTGCPAYAIGEKYVNGSPIRQDILETALEWISRRQGRGLHERPPARRRRAGAMAALPGCDRLGEARVPHLPGKDDEGTGLGRVLHASTRTTS